MSTCREWDKGSIQTLTFWPRRRTVLQKVGCVTLISTDVHSVDVQRTFCEIKGVVDVQNFDRCRTRMESLWSQYFGRPGPLPVSQSLKRAHIIK